MLNRWISFCMNSKKKYDNFVSKIMLIAYILIAIALIVWAIALFMRQPKFGKPASGYYKSTLEKSAQFRNEVFRTNLKHLRLPMGGTIGPFPGNSSLIKAL